MAERWRSARPCWSLRWSSFWDTRTARRSSCRSACRGSARTSVSTRCRRSSLSSSISAEPRRASMASETARHEHSPERVLPFFPAFLAGMNVVLLADDAYTFLLSWEFMSIASWALVMAHHREGDNARAGYVYIVMASFGTLDAVARLRFARKSRRRLRLRRHARGEADARRRRPRLHSGADRRGVEGGDRAAACLAAARPPCGAEPCLRPDERGHDEGRRLRLRPDRV